MNITNNVFSITLTDHKVTLNGYNLLIYTLIFLGGCKLAVY